MCLLHLVNYTGAILAQASDRRRCLEPAAEITAVRLARTGLRLGALRRALMTVKVGMSESWTQRTEGHVLMLLWWGLRLRLLAAS